MTNRDNLKNIITESLKYASNRDIANAYNYVVHCEFCPFWHDSCFNADNCYSFILDKLEAEGRPKHD